MKHTASSQEADAWDVFSSLAVEHDDVALHICGFLHPQHRRRLRGTCSRIRALLNKATRAAVLPASFGSQLDLLTRAFPYLQEATVTHGKQAITAYCRKLQKALHDGPARQLATLHIHCDSNSAEVQLRLEQRLLEVCSGLPRLAVLEISRISWYLKMESVRMEGPLARVPAASPLLQLHLDLPLEGALPLQQRKWLRHLQVLVLGEQRSNPDSAGLFASLAQLSSLTRLVVPYVDTREQAADLAALPSLRSLAVWTASEETFAAVAQLQQLTKLCILDKHAPGQHAGQLTALQSLRHLELSSKAVLITGQAELLLAMPQLTHLWSVRLAKGGRIAISPTLQSLGVARTIGDAPNYIGESMHVSRLGPPSPAGMLTSLHYCSPVTAGDLCVLATHTALQHLSLVGLSNESTLHMFRVSLLPLTNLTCLKLDNYGGLVDITDEALGVLAELQQLRCVHLRHMTRNTDVGLMPIVGLPRLRAVEIEGALRVSSAFLAALLAGAAPSLRKVHMWSNALSGGTKKYWELLERFKHRRPQLLSVEINGEVFL